ncbi:hypothetical protein FRC09_005671 [Ceratobasidium sp. 395]|nr:hypothetical protein FRC09_005671 [Ceratobasidium sp. 395]
MPSVESRIRKNKNGNKIKKLQALIREAKACAKIRICVQVLTPQSENNYKISG